MRYYVNFIICHKAREIIQFAITKNPTKEFIKQQLIIFEETFKVPVFLIHDRSGEFFQEYTNYNIKNIVTSVKAPNMNSIAERFIRTVRFEALDNFIIFNEGQLRNILKDYIEYYNSMRPHQGIEQQIPLGSDPPDNISSSTVKSKPILYGLHHHYYRKSA